MRSKALFVYLFLQALAITGFAYAPPFPKWGYYGWQTGVGWLTTAGVLIGVRLHKPRAARAWYLFAMGVFLNSSGIIVDGIRTKIFNDTHAPSVADAFWLGLFPGLIGGITVIVRARTAEDKSATLGDTATITTGIGLLSWVFLIRPGVVDPNEAIIERIAHLLYPLGDLVVIGLVIRLLLGGGSRSASFRFIIGSMACFMASDVVWALLPQSNGWPLGTLLGMNSMWAWALIGASALHPSVTTVAQPVATGPVRLSPLLMVTLMVATLMAPVVLVLQALKHDVVDGIAIALSSMIMFMLVVLRMTQLRGRIAERNHAVRLVLDTVNEGLLRVSEDGILSEERSAMIDQWFGPFQGRVTFVDYIAKVDAEFALRFRADLETLQEDVMPVEVCLHQMPRRLLFGERQFSCNYLPVIVGNVRQGLLVVIEEVTEQLRLESKEAEHRELLALFQEFTRDRRSFLSFFDEVSELIQRAVAVNDDVITQMRTLHTIKGAASIASLTVIADLCHRAEDEVEGNHAVRMTPLISALNNRWRALTEAFRVFLGDDVRDSVELRRPDLEQLVSEARAGLSLAAISERLDAWLCEPVERPLERLADAARSLSARLGKGNPVLQIEANQLRLDPQRWSGLWAEMIHMVRNAVDHGFEEEDERIASGKSARPSLRLGVYRRATGLSIEIEDDGRGLDWDAIRRSALAKGLKADTERALLDALLGPGLSTRTEVSATSGRGVGVSAVSARVRGLGGDVTVSSKPGAGTCWRFVFPLSSMEPLADSTQDESGSLDSPHRGTAFGG